MIQLILFSMIMLSMFVGIPHYEIQEINYNHTHYVRDNRVSQTWWLYETN